MSRMSDAAKERLREAAEHRKTREMYARREAYEAATPRVLVPRPDHPNVVHASNVMFEPAHDSQYQTMNLTGKGPFLSGMKTQHRPDSVRVSTSQYGGTIQTVAAAKAGGLVLKPLPADLRRYDAMGERILRLQRERRALLTEMAKRARPLTADEVVALGKQNLAAREANWVRPETLAKKVKLPR
jgi:hypothetical protein